MCAGKGSREGSSEPVLLRGRKGKPGGGGRASGAGRRRPAGGGDPRWRGPTDGSALISMRLAGESPGPAPAIGQPAPRLAGRPGAGAQGGGGEACEQSVISGCSGRRRKRELGIAAPSPFPYFLSGPAPPPPPALPARPPARLPGREGPRAPPPPTARQCAPGGARPFHLPRAAVPLGTDSGAGLAPAPASAPAWRRPRPGHPGTRSSRGAPSRRPARPPAAGGRERGGAAAGSPRKPSRRRPPPGSGCSPARPVRSAHPAPRDLVPPASPAPPSPPLPGPGEPCSPQAPRRAAPTGSAAPVSTTRARARPPRLAVPAPSPSCRRGPVPHPHPTPCRGVIHRRPPASPARDGGSPPDARSPGVPSIYACMHASIHPPRPTAGQTDSRPLPPARASPAVRSPPGSARPPAHPAPSPTSRRPPPGQQTAPALPVQTGASPASARCRAPPGEAAATPPPPARSPARPGVPETPSPPFPCPLDTQAGTGSPALVQVPPPAHMPSMASPDCRQDTLASPRCCSRGPQAWLMRGLGLRAPHPPTHPRLARRPWAGGRASPGDSPMLAGERRRS